jgi:hypothetical protein
LLSTEVIYARVPTALKEAADAYAAENGKTLAGAVAGLLDRGLKAMAGDESANELGASLARVTAEKVQVDAELRSAQTQLATLSTFAERASLTVGTCPKCHRPITGHDLLAAGQCPHCHQPLSSLIVPEKSSTLDQRELLLLVGALGAVLAVAYLAAKK